MAQSKLYPPSHRPVPPAAYHVQSRPRSSQPWLLGVLALAALALVPQDLWSRVSTPLAAQSTQSHSAQPLQVSRNARTCQTIVNADQRLSRGQLTQFLSISQNSSQANVHKTIAPPYCTLSKAHQAQQRDAYPLAFDPETWFVINYEQGVYKSYDFVFQK